MGTLTPPLKIRYLIGLLLIGAICGTAYYFKGPVPDDRVQHKFLLAAGSGDIPAMERLHTAGARLDSCASYEKGALHCGPAIYEAIQHERADSVRWLLNRGAYPDTLIATETPLDIAENCAMKRPTSEPLREIVALLKSRGARRLSEL